MELVTSKSTSIHLCLLHGTILFFAFGFDSVGREEDLTLIDGWRFSYWNSLRSAGPPPGNGNGLWISWLNGLSQDPYFFNTRCLVTWDCISLNEQTSSTIQDVFIDTFLNFGSVSTPTNISFYGPLSFSLFMHRLLAFLMARATLVFMAYWLIFDNSLLGDIIWWTMSLKFQNYRTACRWLEYSFLEVCDNIQSTDSTLRKDIFVINNSHDTFQSKRVHGTKSNIQPVKFHCYV